MDSFLLSQVFSHFQCNSNVYILQKNDALLLLVLYVDDLILTRSSSSLINHVKSTIHQQFDMTYLGNIQYFLGLQITQSRSRINIAHPKNVFDLLNIFHMLDCKSTPMAFLLWVKLSAKCSIPLVDETLYRQLVGNLLYLTHNHPDISYAVGLVSWFMQEPHDFHWKVAKGILLYIRGTHTYGVHYSSDGNANLVGYMTLIELVILMTASAPLAMSSILDLVSLLGIARRNLPSLFILHKKSTKVFLMLPPSQSVIHISKEPVEH